jgi:hypothetical protein
MKSLRLQESPISVELECGSTLKSDAGIMPPWHEKTVARTLGFRALA